MKKLLLSAAFMAASFTSIAQVGVGTTNPEAALDIKSNALESTAYTLGNGVLVPRFNVLPAVAGADEGELVYVNGLGLYYYSGTSTQWTAVGGCNQSTPIVYPQTTQVASNSSGGTFTFMNYNLGANTSLDPHVPVRAIHGDYYQWGKNAPDANVDAVIGGTWGNQGGSTANGNWTPTEKGPNDPCPDGFRVPSQAEWQAVHDNNEFYKTGLPWTPEHAYEFDGALHYGPNVVTPALTLPLAGERHVNSGAASGRGNRGRYWSSTENGSTHSYYLFFNQFNGVFVNNTVRNYGHSVRCIAE
jgi:uncharacterized protein (TIGR02145 family)